MKMLNMITGIIKDYTKEDIENRETIGKYRYKKSVYRPENAGVLLQDDPS
jgi:hypothetical protein